MLGLAAIPAALLFLGTLTCSRARTGWSATGREGVARRILARYRMSVAAMANWGANLFLTISFLSLQAAAWKQAFDGSLHERAARGDEEFVAFDAVGDYDAYVDGKPRYDGVRSSLTARGIDLPQGDPADPAEAETIDGLGNRENELVVRLIRDRGAEAHPGSLRYVKAARDAGLATAVVSSSANCRALLIAAGIEDLFAARIDGVVAEREHLQGKPAPDMFLAGARALGVAAEMAAVFEDALVGVAVGRAGGFACVVGVHRAGQASALCEHGAGIVVGDLAGLLDVR